MGLSLHYAHHVVSDALRQGVEARVLGKVDGVLLLVRVRYLDVDQTFLQVL